MADREALASLLGAIDATAAGFTLCEVGRGVRLLGTALQGVSAYQVLHGTMYLSVPDGKVHMARQGSLVLVPAGVRPAIAAEREGNPTVIDGESCFGRKGGWLVADATRGGRADLLVAAARITGTGAVALAQPVVLPVGREEAGLRAVTLLAEEFARPNGSRALASALMSACIVFGLRGAIEQPAAADAPDHRQELIARVINLIGDRPGDQHSLDSLARVAGMSRATFARQFSRLIGTSPMDYLLRRRLKEASAMLRATDLSVKMIAASTGFVSPSHFSRAFRSAYGRDPSSYRSALEVD